MTEFASKLHEECGVFGIFRQGEGEVVSPVYHALYALQHRGQESCGIAINQKGVITSHKDTGLVNDVFTKDVLERLPQGKIAVGHCRYAPNASINRANAQPIVLHHHKGALALCHNGNLINTYELREMLSKTGTVFHTDSDAELISCLISKERLNCGSIEEALLHTMENLKGAYSLILMSPKKLIVARDPHGFRPLSMGQLGEDIVFASETCAFDAVGAKFIRDIKPGEVVVVTEEGIQSHMMKTTACSSLCVFEFIYFARPDSVIEGSSVHVARLRAGSFLALEHPAQADVVVGVPDSGIDAAIGFSRQSGIPYGIGFIKNKYIGRTFIQPNQAQRQNSVRIKLNAVEATVKDKRVVLVDDSIVRGTTSARIVKLLREAGAKEVHMRLSSPPFKFPCYFGTDIDSTDNLIAAQKSIEEIRQIIDVDSLGFLNVNYLDKLADNSTCGFCSGCFTGKYPIDPTHIKKQQKYMQFLESKEDVK